MDQVGAGGLDQVEHGSDAKGCHLDRLCRRVVAVALEMGNVKKVADAGLGVSGPSRWQSQRQRVELADIAEVEPAYETGFELGARSQLRSDVLFRLGLERFEHRDHF